MKVRRQQQPLIITSSWPPQERCLRSRSFATRPHYSRRRRRHSSLPRKQRRSTKKLSKPSVRILEREVLRTYSDLIRFSTFEERFDYLALTGQVGTSTFGFDRYLNQRFYSSTEWKKVRNFVLARDEARDLGVEGFDIGYMPLIHHMNPIQPRDLEDFNPDILDPEFLITTCKNTHNAIHFGDRSRLTTQVVERRPNDQSPWRI
nr:MAG TPA: HNH endonuclease bacteriophage, HNH Endonuclease, DNA.52A [Caudoviricetes sp.]